MFTRMCVQHLFCDFHYLHQLYLPRYCDYTEQPKPWSFEKRPYRLFEWKEICERERVCTEWWPEGRPAELPGPNHLARQPAPDRGRLGKLQIVRAGW